MRSESAPSRTRAERISADWANGVYPSRVRIGIWTPRSVGIQLAAASSTAFLAISAISLVMARDRRNASRNPGEIASNSGSTRWRRRLRG